MAIRLKANIGYMPIVEEVSRKFVPKKVKCTASETVVNTLKTEESGFMGGGVRKTVRAGYGECKRNYLFIRDSARSTAPSSYEVQLRNTFKAAVQGRNNILEDLSQITRVQAMWAGGTISGTEYEGAKNNLKLRINGVSAKGYTFNGWIMAVQYAGKKASAAYDTDTFPSNYDA